MTNPLIDDLHSKDLIQTVTIALPTKGMFYEDGILAPGTDPEDIEIRAIGVMAEIYARDPFLVAAGKGLARIVSHVCPSVLQPDRLCEVDVEAILIAARLVSHGPNYLVKHKCENIPEGSEEPCAFETEVDIDLQKTIMNYEPIEYNEEYLVELAEFGQRVWLRPLEYRNALNVVKRSIMIQQTFSEIAEKNIDDLLTDDHVTEVYAKAVDEGALIALQSFADSIYCVETAAGVKVGNREQIVEWLDAIPEDAGKRISVAINSIAEKLREKSKVTYNCPQCGHENNFQLVLDPERLFFSEAGSSKPQKTPSSSSKKSRKAGTRPPKTSRKSPTQSKESASNT